MVVKRSEISGTIGGAREPGEGDKRNVQKPKTPSFV
jgi:hypothetical protein